MTEHFPTPWRVCPYALHIYADNVPKGPARVADLRGWGYLTGKGHGALGLSDDEGIKVQKANAAFIVKAVNNHDALVKALQAVVDQVNDYERVNNLAPNPGRTECWDSVARAKAILGAVGGSGRG